MANPAPRILITRSPSQASGLAQQLADLGLHPIAIPAIDIVAPISFAALDAAITNLPTFHWLIFTSANAVEAFTTRRTALSGTGFNPSINPTATAGAPAPEATPSLLDTGFRVSINPTGREGASALETTPSLLGTGFSPSISHTTNAGALAPEGMPSLLGTGFSPSVNPTGSAGSPAPETTPSLLGTGFSPSISHTGSTGALAPETTPSLLGTDFSPSANPTGSAGSPAPEATPSLLGTGFSPSVNHTGSAGASAPEGLPPTPYSLLPTPCLIASIGPATARALEAHGLKVNILPPQAIAESLTESLLPHALQPDHTPTRFLLIRAEAARDHLPDTLRSAGAQVTIAPAYRTIIPETSIAAIRDLFTDPANYPDAITFTSSSTATNLLALLEASNLTLPPEILRISIGPITSQTLRDLNLPPHAESPHPTLPALAATVLQALNNLRLCKTLSSPPEAQKTSNPL
jgi:uroporphyrinogen-III synthase